MALSSGWGCCPSLQPQEAGPPAGCPRKAAGLEEPSHQQQVKIRGTTGWPVAAGWGLSSLTFRCVILIWKRATRPGTHSDLHRRAPHCYSRADSYNRKGQVHVLVNLMCQLDSYRLPRWRVTHYSKVCVERQESQCNTGEGRRGGRAPPDFRTHHRAAGIGQRRAGGRGGSRSGGREPGNRPANHSRLLSDKGAKATPWSRDGLFGKRC